MRARQPAVQNGVVEAIGKGSMSLPQPNSSPSYDALVRILILATFRPYKSLPRWPLAALRPLTSGSWRNLDACVTISQAPVLRLLLRDQSGDSVITL